MPAIDGCRQAEMQMEIILNQVYCGLGKIMFYESLKFENRIFKIEKSRFPHILQGTSIAPSKLLGSAAGATAKSARILAI